MTSIVTSMDTNIDLLKKIDEQAKRFGNQKIKNHSQLKSVKSAIQLPKSADVAKIILNAQRALSGTGGVSSIKLENKPQLKQPENTSTKTSSTITDSTEFNGEAQMTYLLMNVVQKAADCDIDTIISSCKFISTLNESAYNGYNELTDALESQLTQYTNDVDALNNANKQANEYLSSVSAAHDEFSQAKNNLANLEEQAANQSPVSPELQQEIDAAKNTLNSVQLKLDNAIQTYTNFNDNILSPAAAAAQASLAALQETNKKAEDFLANVSPQLLSNIETKRKENDQNTLSLTYLMAIVAKFIGDSANEGIEATAELKKAMAEGSAKDAAKQAEEYDEQVRQAEEMQQTMGCIGKIFGWVVAAVSFVSAVFTGGASLVFAAAALALTVGDQIDQAITGNSFISDAMKPIMEAIVEPLMKLLGSMFASILESFGVDKETAEMIGNIMGAVAAAVVLIASTVLVGSAASKFLGQAVNKLGNKLSESILGKISKSLSKKVVDNAVGRFVKGLGEGLGKKLGLSETQISKIAARANLGNIATSLAATSIQAAGDIVSSDLLVKAAKTKGALTYDMLMQHFLTELGRQMMDHFMNMIDSAQKLLQIGSDASAYDAKASNSIIRHISGVAV